MALVTAFSKRHFDGVLLHIVRYLRMLPPCLLVPDQEWHGWE